MPQAKQVKNYFTFVRGLITEASPLTYPENASLSEENLLLLRNGSRRRRLGIDYEDNYELGPAIVTSTFSGLAVSSHKWSNADNRGQYNFEVVQAGATLYFYDLTQSTGISNNRKSFTVDLSTFKTAYVANVGAEAIEAVPGNGYLFVVSSEIEPFYIEYDSATDTISTTEITIDVRDFWGVDDGLDVDESISTLSSEHNYNLHNQGWPTANITAYEASQSKYPSNAQIWTAGKNATDDFDPPTLVKQYFGNTHAPKGHYVLNAFNRNRTSVSGITITTEVERNRPTTTAFYAGRVFYSGVETDNTGGPTFNGYIFFSQILTEISHAGHCYQEADPTSEIISDLVATDGGTIHIPEIGTVIKLEVISNSLIVFADNGIWRIYGGEDFGFSADAYQVVKITDIGTNNKYTIVKVEDSITFWSDAGIYVLQVNPETGVLGVNNLSETTIQTLFNDISSIAKLYSTGTYDQTAKRISWLYNDSDDFTGDTYRDKYDTELVLDTVLGAFYKHTISSLDTDSPYIAGYTNLPFLLSSEVDIEVEASGIDVVVGSDDIIIKESVTSRGATSIKYLCVTPDTATNKSTITFGQYSNIDFVDWYTADSTGKSFKSFLNTGYEIANDASRNKQAVYVVTHFNRTEDGYELDGNGNITYSNPSGCKVQAKWEWSDSANSGRWSNQQQVYRLKRAYIPSGVSDTFDYGFSVVSSKTKLRGYGKSLSLYFESEEGKDMQLLGWSTIIEGNTVV